MVLAVFPVHPRPTCAVIQNLSSESDGSLLRHLWDSSGFSLRKSLFALKVASRVMPLQLAGMHLEFLFTVYHFVSR